MQQPISPRVESGELHASLNSTTNSIKYRMMKEAVQGYFNNHMIPCVNTPSDEEDSKYNMRLFSEMGTPEGAIAMWNSVYEFLEGDDSAGDEGRTYFAIFDETTIESEDHFQLLLWTQLQYAPCNNIEEVSETEHKIHAPHDADFCIKIAGQRMHIIGMHPQHSRKSRRFPWPILIFKTLGKV